MPFIFEAGVHAHTHKECLPYNPLSLSNKPSRCAYTRAQLITNMKTVITSPFLQFKVNLSSSIFWWHHSFFFHTIYNECISCVFTFYLLCSPLGLWGSGIKAIRCTTAQPAPKAQQYLLTAESSIQQYSSQWMNKQMIWRASAQIQFC